MLQATSKVGIGKSTVTSKRGCRVTQHTGCGYRQGGRKLVTIVQSTTDFFSPGESSCYLGLGLGLKSVTESPNGSQTSSMMWLYLIGTGLLLNRGSFLRLGSVPREPVGDTDPVGFAGLFAFLDPCRPLLFAPTS